MSILIVDDSDFVHTQLKVLLSTRGHHDFEFAFQAQEAFDILGMAEGQHPNRDIELVLMDVVMPGMDGMEAVQHIRSHPEFADLPVIMITGDPGQETLVAAFEAGATDFLVKPLGRMELLARVDSALRLKRETDRRMANEQELTRLNRDLKEAFERIAGEMDLVASLQSTLLPSHAPHLAGIKVDTLYRPSGRASGDYFDYLPLGPQGMRLVIADVAGHGTQAAFIMAIVRTLFHAGTTMGMPLEGILSLVNSHLMATLGTEGQFVTVFAADLDMARGQMSYINAGHCPCMLLNGPGAVEHLEPMTPPAGIRQYEYLTRSLALSSTGRLFLYTDGLYEWFVEPDRLFGIEPFKLLSEQLLHTEDDFLPAIEAHLKTLTGRRPDFSDDLTALLATWDTRSA